MSEEKPGDANSAFKARLDALRSKGAPNPPAQTPSLRDRLQQGGPAPSGAANIRSSIQERFRTKQAASPPTAAPQSQKTETPIQFENLQEIPNTPSHKQEEERTESWNMEQGGMCPSCQSFNNGGVAFCNSCGYMLLRSEIEIEVITSYPLQEIKGLAHTFVNKLKELNIRTTEDILRVASNRKNRDMISKRTGLSERSILRLVHTADICRVPSMGPENAAMLELIAITTLAEMMKLKPLELYNKIQQAKIKMNQQGILFLPTKKQVAQWFEEASELQPIKII
ncbi:hypothetical protein COW36_23975 [bacterium (Candidatus Blackallbacteria) CG17_big_fil_post_rev_8_21_14_2_50_48_46]|uniref:DUF4332 domain-containing protein n=1 Tax=bacterium (Candidatus Blackallbacteria) CG17_big_fil_post_rev_8_21_14_2_50_48_46 TaxID=2014261 RepID=A0A2M7FXC5_9BACT|nr:MAG: hypothetical protein COW64_18915 [bacterium (Candidatus Blackallbacteria) CG18_big_fil_WC_8_21_14_2_50_49_26]PIW13732.1 MAG: hypothetical protein COW36_23975 [bacterium (Candidatus Blackallbacteria) CG17_big_fil_post_rev_8_21_14_2_50_48_46]PIW44958.1 MAG: hypothetical protein COW20_21605 [bacterium (Candidatus Blackallbacteria) CG13_big_fil_rev_8_21_14_2_50_49_14]